MLSDLTILAALRALFKGKPSLEEFIEAHNPTDVYQVEELERRYQRIVDQSGFFT